MSKDDFLGLIAAGLADGTLTPGQAEELMLAYEAGELPLDDPPLKSEDAIRRPGFPFYLLAIGWMISEIRTGPGYPLSDRSVSHNVRDQLRGTTPAQRLAFANRLQDRFEEEAARISRQYLTQQISLQSWQRMTGDMIDRHLIGQTMLGYQTASLTPNQLARLEVLIMRQRAFLSRFADTITIRRMLGSPFTDAAMLRRIRSYSGAGRGEYFRTSEIAAAGSGEGGEGWVYDYISQDDDNTCSRCIEAEENSPYLPGQGPYPGSVCLGAGACRCERVARYDPATYRILGG